MACVLREMIASPSWCVPFQAKPLAFIECDVSNIITPAMIVTIGGSAPFIVALLAPNIVRLGPFYWCHGSRAVAD